MKKQSMFLSAALMVLAIALTAFCVAGCGGDDPTVNNLRIQPAQFCQQFDLWLW
ncbi:MAG: hypothetical protein LBB89_13860 [Treponema sp.]|jgi:hypothetical protein|nr:hypothetical protein [Treponema sp.]